MAQIFEGSLKQWKFVLAFSAFAILFWLLEFLYQYYFFSAGDLKSSIIRSFALAGATFIALSLLSSVLFKFAPKYTKYWTVRRLLGEFGFFFTTIHILAALNFVFAWNLAFVYMSLNPLENPLIFGSIAYPIFALLALTSTDWAVAKLGAKWKMVHRLVYFGFWASVFHFLTINPPAIMNPPGYFLLLVTFLALAGELFLWYKTVSAKSFRTIGTWVGIVLILLYVITAYLKWFAK